MGEREVAMLANPPAALPTRRTGTVGTRGMNTSQFKALVKNGSAAFRKANHEDHPRAPVQRPQRAKPPAALARDRAGEAPGPGRPLVRFTLHRLQLLDVDAKYGSIKDLLDALRYAGAIHDDKEGCITLEVEQVKVRHRRDQRTIIEIEYPEKYSLK